MKLLIIEDDQFYAQRIVEGLQDRSVQTVVIRSAEDALDVDLDQFGGAIIDLMLPNDTNLSGISSEESRGGFSTGLCVARRLLVKKSTLQIVMLTSASNPEAQAWAGEKANSFYIQGRRLSCVIVCPKTFRVASWRSYAGSLYCARARHCFAL
jgi:CheY-like chemotaxis protein